MIDKPNWTVDALKEYFEGILKEKDRALGIALASAKEAVMVAEANAEKWRDNANEWRGAMTDREKKFVSREEFTSYKEATEKALAREKSINDISSGKNIGMNFLWSIILGIISFIAAVIALIIK